jgi:MAF protein
MKGKKILLASASEARRRLLKEAGYDFEVQSVDVQERIAKKMTARKNAMRLARLKARTAARGADADIVVAADTLTAIDGEIIGKPADVEDARRILRMSGGKSSAVVTAICIIDRQRNKTICRADEAMVKMRKLTDADIEAYIASGRAMGKAGAYEILEKNDPYVKSVAGDIETVVGFPRRMFEHMLYRLMCGARFRKERKGKS